MNQIILSNRINNVQISKSVEMATAVARLRASGEKIIGFNIGEADFPPPSYILDATKKALDEGHTRYSLVPGEPFLRDAIVEKLKEDQGINAKRENICVSNGSKQVLYSLFQLLCNPGDEVIIPCPFWVSFPEAVRLSGGKPVLITSGGEKLNLEGIKNAINEKTKAIIINSPNNPSGYLYPAEELQELVRLCKENNIFLISDEAYETLLFNEGQFKGPAAVADQELNNTLIVQSFSKSFCMTGFRVGYVAGPEEIIKGMIKLQSHLCGNVPVFIQKGALAALQNRDAMKQEMLSLFQKRSELAFQLCKEIFPETQRTEGAFFIFPKIQKELLDRFGSDEKLAFHILEEAKVALLPGSHFGCPGYLRICFSTHEQDIEEGFQAIKDCL